MENLINLATNEVADESVSVHQAFEIGEKLFHGMSNQLVFIFSFKCKNMVVPFSIKYHKPLITPLSIYAKHV